VEFEFDEDQLLLRKTVRETLTKTRRSSTPCSAGSRPAA
jgi:hypothetical protein